MDNRFSGSYYNPYNYNDHSYPNIWPFKPDPIPFRPDGWPIPEPPKPIPGPVEYGPNPNNRSSYYY